MLEILQISSSSLTASISLVVAIITAFAVAMATYFQVSEFRKRYPSETMKKIELIGPLVNTVESMERDFAELKILVKDRMQRIEAFDKQSIEISADLKYLRLSLDESKMQVAKLESHLELLNDSLYQRIDQKAAELDAKIDKVRDDLNQRIEHLMKG
jgi:chromosome segregation ATPase